MNQIIYLQYEFWGLLLFTIILAGVGINLASHVLCDHLNIVELNDGKKKDAQTTPVQRARW